jgi:predicted RNase H-like nuclease (RuvC/YqgF family)
MINITLHAIERFCDRIDPKASFQEARSRILDAMTRARRIKERSRMGDAYYVTEELRLIVAEEKGKLTVLSVLELHESEEDQLPPLAIELAKQFTEGEKNLSKSQKEINRLKELDDLRAALDRYKKENQRLREEIDKLSAKRKEKPNNRSSWKFE